MSVTRVEIIRMGSAGDIVARGGRRDIAGGAGAPGASGRGARGYFPHCRARHGLGHRRARLRAAAGSPDHARRRRLRRSAFSCCTAAPATTSRWSGLRCCSPRNFSRSPTMPFPAGFSLDDPSRDWPDLYDPLCRRQRADDRSADEPIYLLDRDLRSRRPRTQSEMYVTSSSGRMPARRRTSRRSHGAWPSAFEEGMKEAYRRHFPRRSKWSALPASTPAVPTDGDANGGSSQRRKAKFFQSTTCRALADEIPQFGLRRSEPISARGAAPRLYRLG